MAYEPPPGLKYQLTTITQGDKMKVTTSGPVSMLIKGIRVDSIIPIELEA